jgi:hypothetical protein
LLRQHYGCWAGSPFLTAQQLLSSCRHQQHQGSYRQSALSGRRPD